MFQYTLTMSTTCGSQGSSSLKLENGHGEIKSVTMHVLTITMRTEVIQQEYSVKLVM